MKTARGLKGTLTGDSLWNLLHKENCVAGTHKQTASDQESQNDARVQDTAGASWTGPIAHGPEEQAAENHRSTGLATQGWALRDGSHSCRATGARQTVSHVRKTLHSETQREKRVNMCMGEHHSLKGLCHPSWCSQWCLQPGHKGEVGPVELAAPHSITLEAGSAAVSKGGDGTPL